MEVWKDIQGFEGIYQVSNLGNVLSLNYRNHGYAKQLTPKCNNSGRLWVELIHGGKRRVALIHRLVGEAFIENPNNYLEINHKDENPKNNRADNLEWCTHEYNIRYFLERHPERLRTGGRAAQSRYGRRKSMQVKQYSMDGELVSVWESSREVTVALGWSDWSISECCRGKRKTAYGFKWQYAS